VAAQRTLGELMRAFGIAPKDGKAEEQELDLFWGGPVAVDSVALVLHSHEFKAPSTRVVSPGVALSTPGEILDAIAEGRGPKQMLMAVGYAGWSPGQLERELEAKGWAVIGAGADLLFGTDHAGKWERAWKLRTQEL
jgi:putative transcriptional regulator